MKRLLILLSAILVSCVPELKPPNCEITQPAEGSEFMKGEDIVISVDANDEDGDIAEVRLFIDGAGISSLAAFPYNFTVSTADLEVGSHSIRVEAVDDDGKEAEATSEFTLKSALPEVQTLPSTTITRDSAVVGGVILDDGGGTISSAGILWGTEPYTGNGFSERTAEIKDNSFKVTLTDLTSETVYYLAFAENESGRSLGDELSFNTIPPDNIPPVCEIVIPTDLSEITRGDIVQISVDASDEDGQVVQVRLFIDSIGISSRTAFPYNFTHPSADMDVGLHSIRVQATDNQGAQTDDMVYFLLKPTLPVVETEQPESVTSESAVVGGRIVDDGGGTISAAGILWGIVPFSWSDYSLLYAALTNDDFTIMLSNLEFATYYAMAFAENESGRSYGELVTFSTLLPTEMFIDNRDGSVYRWVRIGTQIWMAENLAYLPELRNPNNYSDSISFYYVYGYDGFKVDEAIKTSNYDDFGVLYNYPAALDACPDGWHLPTGEEEEELITYIGGNNYVVNLLEAGTDHWNFNPDGTNSSGFSARGGGWATLTGGTYDFANLGAAAGWWKLDSCAQGTRTGMPFTIMSGNPFLLTDDECESFSTGYSIRCVKD